MGYFKELVIFLLCCLVFGWPLVTGLLTITVAGFCLFMIAAHGYCWIRDQVNAIRGEG